MAGQAIRGGVVAAAMIMAAAGHAQTINWDNASGGDWNTDVNWNPINVPNLSTENAQIALSGVYTVNLDAHITIGRLIMNAAGATLQVNAGRSLSLAGLNHTNNGTILVNTFSASNTSMAFGANNAVLSGSGRLTLQGNSPFNNTAVLSTPDMATVFTNAAGHTIDGQGRITAAMTNNGIVEAATNAQTLALVTLPKSNTNIMRASNGGTLWLEQAITQTGGASIQAGAGSTVHLNSPTIIGGTVSSNETGIISINGTSQFRSVTFQGPGRVEPGAALLVTGTGLVNNGVIRVNTLSASNTSMWFNETGVLSGTGRVQLQGNSGFNDTGTLRTPVDVAMTQASGHMIHGRGRIYAALTNNGLIDADDTLGHSITLVFNPKANNATMRATNGGDLTIDGITVTQGGSGVVRAAADSTVSLSNATVVGGTVESTGTGLVSVLGSGAELRGVDFNGNGTVQPSRTLVISGFGIDNSGTIRVNTSSGSNTAMQFAVSGTLGGGGQVILDGNSGFNNTATLDTATGATITHLAGHTIRGEGQVRASLGNAGVIDADEAGHAIFLSGEPKANANIMRATNGGTLHVGAVTVSQSGPAAEIRANADSLVNLGGAQIIGGRVLSQGTGAVHVVTGGAEIRGVQLDGTVNVDPATALHITGGGVTNNAVLSVNTGTGSNTTLHFPENGNFAGTGQVVLQGNSHVNSTAQLSTADGVTVTNNAGHTIRGRGRISATFVNNGAVRADTATSAIEMNVNNKTNNATMAATNGGLLRYSGITVNQGAAGSITADATSTVSFNGMTLVGGTVNASGGGMAQIEASSTFSSVKNQGFVRVNPATGLALIGAGTTNNGLFQVNTGTGSNTTLGVNTTQTINGTGEVRLVGNSPDNSTALLTTDPAATATWGVGQTLTGQGRVLGAHVWRGPIAPGFSAGRIRVDGTLTMTDSTVYRCELGGTGINDYDRLAGSPSGTVNLDGTLDISLIEDFVPSECDSFQIVQAGSVVGRFDAITGADAPGDLVWRVFNDGTSATLKLTCYPDTDGSCTLDLFDILTFLNAFNAGSPDAECDNAPGLNLFDILCFLNEFNAGC